jgi:hypothetical protein
MAVACCIFRVARGRQWISAKLTPRSRLYRHSAARFAVLDSYCPRLIAQELVTSHNVKSEGGDTDDDDGGDGGQPRPRVGAIPTRDKLVSR